MYTTCNQFSWNAGIMSIAGSDLWKLVSNLRCDVATCTWIRKTGGYVICRLRACLNLFAILHILWIFFFGGGGYIFFQHLFFGRLPVPPYFREIREKEAWFLEDWLERRDVWEREKNAKHVGITWRVHVGFFSKWGGGWNLGSQRCYTLAEIVVEVDVIYVEFE